MLRRGSAAAAPADDDEQVVSLAVGTDKAGVEEVELKQNGSGGVSVVWGAEFA